MGVRDKGQLRGVQPRYRLTVIDLSLLAHLDERLHDRRQEGHKLVSSETSDGPKRHERRLLELASLALHLERLERRLHDSLDDGAEEVLANGLSDRAERVHCNTPERTLLPLALQGEERLNA